MKVTVLIENELPKRNSENFISEHGLALYIQTNNKNILFDFGKTGDFTKNAEKLGIDLGAVDFAVLSHGHYDHGGGIAKFLKINDKAKVYISKNALKDFYHGEDKYIGLEKEYFLSDRVIKVDGAFEIEKGIAILGYAPEIFTIDDGGLEMKKDGVLTSDDFTHEQYLSITENDKTYFFSGCSHRGIDNIVSAFYFDYFFGGLHLSNFAVDSRGEFLTKIANMLKNSNAKYFVGHCTGVKQYEFLREVLGDKIEYLTTSKIIEV